MFNDGDLLYGRFRIFGAALPAEPLFEWYVVKDEEDSTDYLMRCFPLQAGQEQGVSHRVLQIVDRRQEPTGLPWPRLIEAFADRTYVYLQEEKPTGCSFEKWCGLNPDPEFSARPAFIRALLNGLAALHSSAPDLYHGGFEPSDIVVAAAGHPVLYGEKWSAHVIRTQPVDTSAMRLRDLASLAKAIAFCFPRDPNGNPVWDQAPSPARDPVFLTRCMWESITGTRGLVVDAKRMSGWISKLEKACQKEREQSWAQAAALYEEAGALMQVPALQARAAGVQQHWASGSKPADVPKTESPKPAPPPPPPPRKPSIAKFEASSSTVTEGGAIKLVWNVDSADKIDIQPDLGERRARGTETVTVHRTTTFVLRAGGPGGETRSITVRAEPRPVPVIDLFEVAPPVIRPGERAKLRWRARNSASTTILPDIGIVDAAGEREVIPAGSIAYQLIAVGAGTSVNRQVTLTVAPPPRVDSFSARPLATGTYRIEWKTAGAEQVDILPGLGRVPAAGVRDVQCAPQTTLTLSAKGLLGQHTEASLTAIAPPPAPRRFGKWIAFWVIFLALAAGGAYWLREKQVPPVSKSPNMLSSVNPDTPKKAEPFSPPDASAHQPDNKAPDEHTLDENKTGVSGGAALKPTIQFMASEYEIPRGQSAKLSWSVQGATEVSLEPGFGVVPSTSSKVVSPEATTEYQLIARYASGDPVVQSRTINVTGIAPRITKLTADPDPPVVAPGQRVVLSWTAEGASRVSLQPEPGRVESSGSRTFSLTATKKFTLVAEGSGGAPTQQDIWITVDPRLAAPSLDILRFTAQPDRVAPGGNFALSWQTRGASEVTLELVKKPDQSLASLPPSTQGSSGELQIRVDDQFSRYGTYEYRLIVRSGTLTKEQHVFVEIVRPGR